MLIFVYDLGMIRYCIKPDTAYCSTLFLTTKTTTIMEVIQCEKSFDRIQLHSLISEDVAINVMKKEIVFQIAEQLINNDTIDLFEVTNESDNPNEVRVGTKFVVCSFEEMQAIQVQLKEFSKLQKQLQQ